MPRSARARGCTPEARLEGGVALERATAPHAVPLHRQTRRVRAAERAGQESAALLDARRQNCELAAQLAIAHAALERCALETRTARSPVARLAVPAGPASRKQDHEALVETQPLT